MKVLLNELEAGQWSDKWYTLNPVNITNKPEGGSLRVSVRYLHEIIMPLKEYTSLKEVNRSHLLRSQGRDTFAEFTEQRLYHLCHL